ncbi:hypothetical protein CLOM_g9479, partial [Closterium sp. NIES-68]
LPSRHQGQPLARRPTLGALLRDAVGEIDNNQSRIKQMENLVVSHDLKFDEVMEGYSRMQHELINLQRLVRELAASGGRAPVEEGGAIRDMCPGGLGASSSGAQPSCPLDAAKGGALQKAMDALEGLTVAGDSPHGTPTIRPTAPPMPVGRAALYPRPAVLEAASISVAAHPPSPPPPPPSLTMGSQQTALPSAAAECS